jgi:cyclophilin family peptidyl-prolyl cis-trans isomerase
MVKLTGTMKRFDSGLLGSVGMMILVLSGLGLTQGFAQDNDPAPDTGEQDQPGLRATLERLGNFYYAGDPVQVRVAVFNTGTEPLENVDSIDMFKGLTIGDTTGATSFQRKANPAGGAKYRPAALAPGGFFGMIMDLRDVFSGMDTPGKYSVRLQLDGVNSDPVLISIIPRYDPTIAYRALIETDYGTVAFDLLGNKAPKHVKNFYELANQGYYDGSFFISVMKGVQMTGGDRTGDGNSSPGYDLPMEIHSTVRHSRGTLSMLRKQNADHGGQFIISLGDNPAFDGQFTLFGIISEGSETLAALESLPTNGRNERPFFRPLSPIRVSSISAAPAPESSRATAESQAVKGSADSSDSQ